MTTKTDCPTPRTAHSLSILAARGIDMRRDDELLRQLLVRIEDHDDWIFHHYVDSGSSDEHVTQYYHLQLLADAGLLEETGKHGGNFRMKSQGYDFLEAIRSEAGWGRVKSLAGKAATSGVEVLVQVAKEMVQQQIKAAMGLP